MSEGVIGRSEGSGERGDGREKGMERVRRERESEDRSE